MSSWRVSFIICALSLSGCNLSAGAQATTSPTAPPPQFPFSDPDAQAVCERLAPEWSGTAVGAFTTTLGRVRRLGTFAAAPDRWDGLSDLTPTVVCYVDGAIPKAPPDGPPYDRAVVAVVNGEADLIIAGYRSQLPVEVP